jgi:sulfofructose kinase
MSKPASRPSRPKPSKGSAPTKRPAAPKPAPQRKARRAGGGRPHAPEGAVVAVGLATVDLIGVAPHGNDRITELSVFSMQGGGSAANTLATLAVLGAKTRFFGRLGDDSFGQFALAAMKAMGVDTSMVDVEAHKVSPISFITIDELTRRRRITISRGSITPLEPQDVPQRILAGAALLCIDGTQPALQAALAEKARAKGVPVLLNAGRLAGGMGELLALADVVIGSERFASEFAPSDSIERSLREITRLGPRVAVITLGNEGACALEGDKLVAQEPLDVLVSDTTGAGDVFCGAFAYAFANGWPLERTLPFANAAAGLKCRTLGARSGIPSLEDVLTAVRGS